MYHIENPNIKNNFDVKSFMGALEDNGLLEHNFVDNFVDRHMPKPNKDKASRTEADIAERKSKQEAKLARRAKANKT